VRIVAAERRQVRMGADFITRSYQFEAESCSRRTFARSHILAEVSEACDFAVGSIRLRIGSGRLYDNGDSRLVY
jgi:hypothetical protein